MIDRLNTALQTIFDSLPGFSDAEYRDWIAATALDESDLQRLTQMLGKLAEPPKLDVLIACGSETTDLVKTLDSLSKQVWPKFSILIGCPREDLSGLQRLVEVRASANPQIRVVPADAAEGDVLAMEQAVLAAAQGDYVGFLAPGDILPLQATAEIVLALSRLPDTVALFTDEDWIDAHGLRSRPRFKHGWDIDAHLGFDLMGRFTPMRREAVLAAGGLETDANLAAHYALHCRVAELAGPSRILHVPSVLRHAARQPATSPELADDYAASARIVAKDAALRWEGANVVVSAAPLASWFNRIQWPLPDPAPLVSILLPTRDHPELLEASALGVLQKTDYPAIELLILDNGSVIPETIALFGRLARDPRVRILPMPGPFNYSKLNNDGATAAQGEILVLLNNDIEMIGADWLREMVSLAIRPEIGCVGAKLLYADHRIQHAGIGLTPNTGCTHFGRLLDHRQPGEMGTLAVTRAHSAVTAACLAIRAEVFTEIGGLDEVAFSVGYNDVDLCLKARDHGYKSVCSPFASLTHLESVTRKMQDDAFNRARERTESVRIVGRWREVFMDDPNENPNVFRAWNKAPILARSRRLNEWEGKR